MFTRLQIFLLLLFAPFIGLIVVINDSDMFVSDQLVYAQIVDDNIEAQLNNISDNIFKIIDDVEISKQDATQTNKLLMNIRNNVNTDRIDYENQNKRLDSLVQSSISTKNESVGVLDKILANILGEPIGQTFGEKATIKVYSLKEAGYRGYMAKVRIHDPKAIKMVLADDNIESKGETTSQAAKREDAILAVNAGGFTAVNGNIRPLGITIIDGEIITYSENDLSVIGFNKQGNLVGGNIKSKQEIYDMEIINGASFLPTLLKNSVKQPIPKEWANARHPRTLIGHFENGDLLFIVIDGRRDGWSNGVTLEEAQNKLLEFNVRDAYNLDGGGSSTFYYNGKVLNKPSGGYERRVTTNIVITQ